MQPIIISRFLINLQRADRQESANTTLSGHSFRFTTPRFRVPTMASIIGDMDKPLEHGPTAEEAADVWEVGNALQAAKAEDHWTEDGTASA